MKRLQVEIWSDIACPWCYVGKRRFEAALARFAERASVDVRWRAFELNPAAPRVEDFDGSYAERLARKYGASLAHGEEMIRTMTASAADERLDFHFERIRPGNTFDAHRLVHFAAERALGDATKERLFRAYMTEGQPMGEREVLARLAGEVGLEADEVRTMLDSDAFESEVRADENEARARGIGGVPYFLVGGHYGLSGAQPAEVLLQTLRSGWQDLAAESPVKPPADGAACGPDGCE